MLTEPTALPRTTPALLTEAMVLLEELQVPPVVVSVKVIVLPVHTEEEPVNEPAVGPTVMRLVTEVEPHELETV
jgi:hypothetical protein